MFCAEKNWYNVKRSGGGLHTIAFEQGDVSEYTSPKRLLLDQTAILCGISGYDPGAEIDSLFPLSLCRSPVAIPAVSIG